MKISKNFSFADIVIALGVAVFLAWSGVGINMLRENLLPSGSRFVMIGLPILLAILTASSFWLQREYRIVTALCFASAAASLYMAEAYFEASRNSNLAGRPGFDPRSKIEIIADLRRQGIDAYPIMRAKTLLLPTPDKSLTSVLGSDGFLPLASLPHRRVVSCNEGGSWLIYNSDRHGFNNPDEVWDGKPPLIAMLGDSFAHGSCVASDKNTATWLRTNLGKTINLGVSGFGPLSMLAALSEYAEPLRPANVLWLFFEGNDLNDDLPFERRSPLLRSYLELPAFRQGLIERQGEVETRLKTYLDERLTEAMTRFDNPNERLMDFLQLYHLRERFGLGPLSLVLTSPTDLSEQGKYFARILQQANERTSKWGGKLWLVYLPESARYFASSQSGELRRRIHQTVIKAASADFALAAKPGDFFEYPGSHYNEAGYRRLGEIIKERLN
jgi:hypothetical protein